MQVEQVVAVERAIQLELLVQQIQVAVEVVVLVVQELAALAVAVS